MTDLEGVEGRPTPPRLVRYERVGRVAVVTLDNPDKLNVIDHGPDSMAAQLLDALRTADDDDDIGCIVLTGQGRAFSAGGGLGGMARTSPADWYAFIEGNAAETQAIRSLRKPTIGAINGICYGFGLILATHLDMIVASAEARFGLIETRIGSTGAQTLPYLVGPQWAKFLALSGEIISAQTARDIGLVLQIFPHDTFRAKVMDLARRVSEMPAEAVVLNKRVINSAMDLMGWETQRNLSTAINTVTNMASVDARSADGRRFADIMRDEGWSAYKAARDEPFTPPWLD
ncbi:enoyl-CoA hydratase/isomerase family protein [uncultured Arthrobacter sp.]|uniref:enoyl-CoA hydratase/isomerase family protein n=1 Tax=uncultured Arthrobacter sp. TaxID=114050 RepID=UPI0025FF7885|nr:enoyl-CoA hydratase/isomerase family protein [uncultured Arthrobacter sp.]